MVTISFPSVPTGIPDNVVGSGGKIALIGSGAAVALLGSEVGTTRR